MCTLNIIDIVDIYSRPIYYYNKYKFQIKYKINSLLKNKVYAQVLLQMALNMKLDKNTWQIVVEIIAYIFKKL